MKISDIFGYAGSSIKQQKVRSSLTILGVVIGIAAIVALNSLTAGFSASLTSSLEQGLSANTLTVVPGESSFFSSGSSVEVDLHVNSTDAIEELDHVMQAIPVIQRAVSIRVDDENNKTVMLYGIDFIKYWKIFDTFTTEDGLGSIPDDNESFVVGYSFHDPFKNGTEFLDVGDNLTIYWSLISGSDLIHYNYSAEISGILGEIGGFSLGGGPSDNNIYLPIDKAIEIFGTDEVSLIIVEIDDNSDAVIEEVSDNIKVRFQDGVTVTSAGALLDTLGSVFDTMSIFLTSIAAISLVVAGIGIMNIMTVSIMERTREIGILKALGLRDGEILSIFLVEALLIGLIGSFIGLVSGYGGAWLLGNFLGGMPSRGASGTPGGSASGLFGSDLSIMPIITVNLVVQAIGFGILVAVVFGLYPAWKASRKPPVEALRYE
ncbi:MAG: ABC transporter permease [Promethearchaeota archaeon]